MRILLIIILFISIHFYCLAKGSYTVTDIPNIANWCSNKDEFKVEKLDRELNKTDCSEGKFVYGKYFRVRAKSNFIDIVVKTDFGKHALKEPVIYLMDEDLNPLACVNRELGLKSIGLYYDKLNKKDNYIVGVLTEYEEKNAHFTICMNDKVSSNTPLGAIPIEDTEDYCTKPTLSLDFTPTSPKISCMEEGPNHNSWYKFTAQKKSIHLEVKAVNKMGKFQHPFIGLFDQNLNEVKCARFENETTAKLNFYDLTIGANYYVSVDQAYYKQFMGGFVLCLSNKLDKNYFGEYKIVGRLTSSGNAVAGHKVNLIDIDTKNVLRSVEANEKGQFRFEELPSEVSYEILLEIPDPKIKIDVFMLDQDDHFYKKGEKKEDKVVVLKDIQERHINIVDDELIESVIIEPGKTAIVGKVVFKEAPFLVKSNLEVHLYDDKDNLTKTASTDKDGGFTFTNLKASKGYSVKLMETEDKDFYTEMVYLNDQKEVMMYTSSKLMDEEGNFRFQKLPHAKADIDMMQLEDVDDTQYVFDFGSSKGIVIENVYFKSADYELLPSSFTELDVLVVKLKENTSIKVEIQGYTDNLGNSNDNLILSENRAKAVVNYLVDHGIGKSRLKYVGLGKENPIADNTTPEGRQKNRRVEFMVIQ